MAIRNALIHSQCESAYLVAGELIKREIKPALVKFIAALDRLQEARFILSFDAERDLISTFQDPMVAIYRAIHLIIMQAKLIDNHRNSNNPGQASDSYCDRLLPELFFLVTKSLWLSTQLNSPVMNARVTEFFAELVRNDNMPLFLKMLSKEIIEERRCTTSLSDLKFPEYQCSLFMEEKSTEFVTIILDASIKSNNIQLFLLEFTKPTKGGEGWSLLFSMMFQIRALPMMIFVSFCARLQ